MVRFERFGEVKDIDEAIMQQSQAVQLVPLDSPNLPTVSTTLGIRCWFDLSSLGR